MQVLLRYLLWAIVSLILALGASFRIAAEDHVYSRRTAIVEAVAKTRDAILSLRVEKKGSFSRLVDTVGTAVIIADRGYAITNAHVVANATHISAFAYDGTPIGIKVLESVPQHDLAILQLDGGRSYHHVPLGPSSDLMLGEEVIAIGNPFGYVNTVSRGIISALNREIPIPPPEERLTGIIQTDAPINPGSSGGPLLNINGELIGINVAMHEGAQGIAFAIPSDTVKSVLAESLSAKKVSGVELGLQVEDKVVAETGPRQKVIIAGMPSQALAAKAGIQPGDQIVQVAGHAIANVFDVEQALWDVKPGAKVPLRLVTRDGMVKEALLTLPEPPTNQIATHEKVETNPDERGSR